MPCCVDVADIPSPPVLFLTGPTASGKTELAVRLVRRMPLDIISVDCAMVYRGLDIGTAKPGADVLKAAPHRLIDICAPSEAYSAGRFRQDALREIQAVHARGRIPLLVGGTGLYFRSLERGLSRVPPASADIRAALSREAEERGWPALHAALSRVDPEAAARVHPNDSQRIQRALEVHRSTGKPLSEWFRAGRAGGLPWKVCKLVVSPSDRGAVRERVRRRFAAMLDRGFMNEMRGLYARGDLHRDLPSMRLVGYRQGWQYLAGEIDYDAMVERATAATRQLVKRQLTWLRAEPDANWFDAEEPRLEDKLLKFLEQGTNFPVRV